MEFRQLDRTVARPLFTGPSPALHGFDDVADRAPAARERLEGLLPAP